MSRIICFTKETLCEGYGLEPPAVDRFPCGGRIIAGKGLGLAGRASPIREFLSFETVVFLVVPGRVELPTSTLSV